MLKPFKHDLQWAKAKQVCRLSMEDIQMAKELGSVAKDLDEEPAQPVGAVEAAGETLDSRTTRETVRLSRQNCESSRSACALTATGSAR
jgi:hypothetical protein